MHREPEVPEERVPVVECLDGPARITSKELAPIHSVKKWHPPECLFYKSESGCRFGEKCSCAHRQVEEQPSKRFKKNCDISAVAMCKRNEQHQRTGRLVLDAYSSSTRQLGCVFPDMEPPKSSSILRKSSEHTETNPMCKIHKSPSCVTLTFETKIHRLEWFAQ